MRLSKLAPALLAEVFPVRVTIGTPIQSEFIETVSPANGKVSKMRSTSAWEARYSGTGIRGSTVKRWFGIPRFCISRRKNSPESAMICIRVSGKWSSTLAHKSNTSGVNFARLLYEPKVNGRPSRAGGGTGSGACGCGLKHRAPVRIRTKRSEFKNSLTPSGSSPASVMR